MNIHEWQDMVGTSGLYKIRLSEDNRTVEVIGRRGKKLTPNMGKKGYLSFSTYVRGFGEKKRPAHHLAHIQWNDPSHKTGMERVIDHIDGDLLNNNPKNLRAISNRDNCSRQRTERSGLPVGVWLRKDTGKYVANIWFGKKKVGLGDHFTVEEAHNAYLAALKNGREHYV